MRNQQLSAALLLCLTLAAQSPDTFEVASIKLGDPMASGTSYTTTPGAGIKIDGADLKSLVLYAYDLRDYQLVGVKGWMTAERYTIRATGVMEGGPADSRHMSDRQSKALLALTRKRLRALLAERFQLAVHSEIRQLPTYALVVAKGGSKLRPNLSADGTTQGMTTGTGMMKADRASMDSIAEALAGLTGRPVRDETGLRGFFDAELKWTPDAAPSGSDGAPRPAAALGPTIFTALQEQLGLKLESRKGPVEIVVIDRAEHPSEN